MKLLITNKSYNNLDIKGQYFKSELATSHEVICMESKWPERKLKLKDKILFQELYTLHKIFHKLQITTTQKITCGQCS